MPPVTAERSPPDSRMTGALSPVIADSSTNATPSTISPSPGMNSPTCTSTTSSLRSCGAGTCSVFTHSIPAPTSPVMRLATASVFALRSVSACAFPRPSAIASAKLPNSTVNQSHSVTCTVNIKLRGSPCATSRMTSSVVNMLPISTTNITGFFATCRGLSFLNASLTARLTIDGSNNGLFFALSDI